MKKVKEEFKKEPGIAQIDNPIKPLMKISNFYVIIPKILNEKFVYIILKNSNELYINSIPLTIPPFTLAI